MNNRLNSELLKMATEAIRANPLRSVLTTLGIIIGTAIVIIVLSIGAGIEALILNELSSIKPESLYIEVQVPFEGTREEKDANTAQTVSSGVQITTLKLDDVEDIKEHYNIEKGYGMSFTQAKLSRLNETKTAMVFAVQEDYVTMEQLEFSEGRFFTDQEDNSLATVIVLGSKIKEELFGSSEAVGQNVKLEQKNYEVVGVVEPIGTKFFMDVDEAVYMPVQTVQKKIQGVDHVSAISLQMEDPSLILQTIDDVERILRSNHHIKDPAKDDFVIRTQDEAMKIVGAITGGISALLLSLAAISLVVGGVGIMNIMYVAVTERTHEIGLRKAIGARPSSIKKQFIFEAILITMVGGVIGILGGTFVSWSVSAIANLLGFNWPFVVSVGSITFSFLSSSIVGLVFGYAPAKKASELDPILALRG